MTLIWYVTLSFRPKQLCDEMEVKDRQFAYSLIIGCVLASSPYCHLSRPYRLSFPSLQFSS